MVLILPETEAISSVRRYIFACVVSICDWVTLIFVVINSIWDERLVFWAVKQEIRALQSLSDVQAEQSSPRTILVGR